MPCYEFNFNEKPNWIGRILGIGAFLVIFCGIFYLNFHGIQKVISEGEMTGVITRISHKGILYKTWEGELNIGSISTDKGGIVTPDKWYFSIENENIIPLLKEKASKGERVTLIYKRLFIASVKQGETNYLIMAIK